MILLNILVLVNGQWMNGFDEWRSEGSCGQIGRLILIVVHLLFAVRRSQPFPGQCIYEQRVLLEVLLECILLGQDSGGVVAIRIVVIIVYIIGYAVGEVAGQIAVQMVSCTGSNVGVV